jgi:hypothetical protein
MRNDSDKIRKRKVKAFRRYIRRYRFDGIKIISVRTVNIWHKWRDVEVKYTMKTTEHRRNMGKEAAYVEKIATKYFDLEVQAEYVPPKPIVW